jgi:hypothetical protein
MYNGIARITGIRYAKPVYDADRFETMHLLLDILVKTSEGEKLMKDLKMSIKEYGEIPILGEYQWVLVKDDRIRIVD